MTPTFFVLGHRGMLGTAVVDVIRRSGHSCATSDLRYAGTPRDPLIEAAVDSGASFVVNCAGITTHRGASEDELLVANALLPQHLAAALPSDRVLFHPSTDCVFGGTRGRYRIDESPDATDPYGLSKRLGELAVAARGARVIVLRTSIIGPERHSSRGLLAWYLSRNAPVGGWQDHAWNGITTLAWAELMLGAATGERPLPDGLHQPGTSAHVSKYELLKLIGSAFGHDVPVEPTTTDAPRDRTLVPTIVLAPIDEQLRALAEWWRAARLASE